MTMPLTGGSLLTPPAPPALVRDFSPRLFRVVRSPNTTKNLLTFDEAVRDATSQKAAFPTEQIAIMEVRYVARITLPPVTLDEFHGA